MAWHIGFISKEQSDLEVSWSLLPPASCILKSLEVMSAESMQNGDPHKFISTEGAGRAVLCRISESCML